MARKRFIRSTRHGWKAAVIWAMVPLAALNVRSVSACLSPSGRLDPNCQCWNHSAPKNTCHCSCCGSANCCCKHRVSTCHLVSDRDGRSTPDGIKSQRNCTPVGAYLVIPATNTSDHLVDSQQLADAGWIATDFSVVPATSASGNLVALDTGPPPDNLQVVLHRWLV